MATLTKRPIIVFLGLLIMSAILTSVPCRAENEGQESYRIRGLSWEETTDDFVLTIEGETPPTYTMYELFNPFRLIVDIADASIDPSFDISAVVPQGPVAKINGQVLKDKEPFIARIELFLGEEESYTVDRLDNDILVKFAKPKSSQPDDPATADPASNEPAAVAAETTTSPESAPSDTMLASEEILGDGQESIYLPLDQPMVSTVTNERKPAAVLFDIEVEHSPTETRVFLKADGTIDDYKTEQLAKDIKANRPDRMYIDVKNVKLAGPIQPQIVGTALTQVRIASRTDGFRVVFDSSLDELFEYNITTQADGLLVTINEPSPATAVIAGLLNTENPTASEAEIAPEEPSAETFANEKEAAETEQALTPAEDQEVAIFPSTNATKMAPAKKDSNSALAFAGYTKQRITVDFYKIDLHNVFRLFGEISNLNMVVDQAVSGSLTLALNDVPWDFALDIILNLKDLRKEERFNTIVISPKGKEFKWPERALDTVEFKADESFDLKQQENGLKINKLQDIPETVVEAKNLIHQAQEREKLGNYTAALALYEESFTKWPENTIIAKRIAGLCLVHLGQNAKAVHYAKEALKADPNNYDSALQAAIGLARMKKTDQAQEFFEKAISGTAPSSAALSSYSAFSEELLQFDRALALLKQHEDLHGDSLETMISKARIHDKQGQRDLASKEYQAILLSGYGIPADLDRYIKGRASLASQQ